MIGDNSLSQDSIGYYSCQTLLSKLCSIYVSPKVSGFDESILKCLRPNPEGHIKTHSCYCRESAVILSTDYESFINSKQSLVCLTSFNPCSNHLLYDALSLGRAPSGLQSQSLLQSEPFFSTPACYQPKEREL